MSQILPILDLVTPENVTSWDLGSWALRELTLSCSRLQYYLGKPPEE